MLKNEVSKKSIFINENGHFSIFWISAVSEDFETGIFALAWDLSGLNGGDVESTWSEKCSGNF